MVVSRPRIVRDATDVFGAPRSSDGWIETTRVAAMKRAGSLAADAFRWDGSRHVHCSADSAKRGRSLCRMFFVVTKGEATHMAAFFSAHDCARHGLQWEGSAHQAANAPVRICRPSSGSVTFRLPVIRTSPARRSVPPRQIVPTSRPPFQAAHTSPN